MSQPLLPTQIVTELLVLGFQQTSKCEFSILLKDLHAPGRLPVDQSIFGVFAEEMPSILLLCVGECYIYLLQVIVSFGGFHTNAHL